jgi:hypothetical protein
MSAKVGIARTLKRFFQASATAQRIYRRYLRGQSAAYLPNWGDVLSRDGQLWDRARMASRTGPKVLIATATGGHPSSPLLESLLGVALTLRGADVRFLLCDSILPACLMAETRLMSPAAFAHRGPQGYFCSGCFHHANSIYEPLGLRVHRFSEFASREALKDAKEISAGVPSEDIGDYVRDGVAIGEHAVAGALRYFARAELTGQSHGEAVLRRYLHAAILTSIVTRNLLDAHPCDTVCINHALYVPQGIVAAVARARGSRVTAWNVAYRNRSFIFSHGETYHHTLMTEPVSEWEHIAWNTDRETQILDYLKSRRRSGRDWIAFQDRNPEEDLSSILGGLGVDPAKPLVGMLTNVAWDAQLHYPANAFRNMLDWVIKTIAYFAKRPEVQLIIRVHPAEVSGGIASRQPVVQEIERAFPSMPGNVFVIPPESRISTYAVMEACNAVIIYGTKTGVELTSLGVPVVVAGEAWIRNKGVTIDATSAEHYFQVLDRLPYRARMSVDTIARARKYAYHFFFRRMIPVTLVAPTGMKDPPFRVDVSRLEDLLPGRDKGLDVICDGIIKGTPFTYAAEEYGLEFEKKGC